MIENMINVGIVGCGWISEHAHLPVLVNMKQVKVEAVFDIDIEKAKATGDKFGIKNAYNNFLEFLNSNIDCAVIATPNNTHFDYALRLLRKKICVLCEKPVVLSAREMHVLCREEKENGVFFIPGFVNRWRKDVQRVYKMLKMRKIGEILSIRAGWIRKNGVPRPGSWFTKRELAGGGVLIDLGSHIFDVCCLFLEDKQPMEYRLITSKNDCLSKGKAQWFSPEIKEQYEIDVEDSAIGEVVFEDDVLLRVCLSWNSSVDGDITYFKIAGTKGEITLKTLFGFSNERFSDRSIGKCEINNNVEIFYDEIINGCAINAFRGMYNYFICCMEGNTLDCVNSSDAQKNVALIENLYLHEIQDRKFIMNNMERDLF